MSGDLRGGSFPTGEVGSCVITQTVTDEAGNTTTIHPVSYTHRDVYKRQEYMRIITAHELENPVLIDKYLMGTETEVDAICDGRDYLIPGIMQHVERAGVHSGDSISVYRCV